MSGNLTNMDPTTIWARSPLCREAVARILDSSGLPLPIALHTEAMSLVLAKLSDMMVVWSMQRQSTFVEKQNLAKTFKVFIDAVRQMDTAGGFVLDLAPSPPIAWVQAMQDWTTRLATEKKRPGAPTKVLYQEVMPRLLSFYELLYNRLPISSVGGPTVRFLSAFLREMNDALRIATWAPPEAGKHVLEQWTVPSADALSMRVRTFKTAAKAETLPLALFNLIVNPTYAAECETLLHEGQPIH